MAKFNLTVPVDASTIEGVEKNHPLKVVVRDASGRTFSEVVRLKDGKASATFKFDEKPAGLRVFVGPEDAADDEMEKLQTVSASVPARLFAREDVVLSPIVVTPFFWQWWLRWCRTYTIRGRVVCPDGSPVPGAQVCAFDIDFFWWWRNTQQIGCAMTDANGAFEITFRWCCGWWPWWWWRLRAWEIDLDLYRRIVDQLPAELKLKRIPLPDPIPDMKFIDTLIAAAPKSPTLTRGPVLTQPVLTQPVLTKPSPALPRLEPVAGAPAPQQIQVGTQQLDLGRLESSRDALVRLLPKIVEADTLRIWPWWPWNPWFDCAPDVIFRVTQDCAERGAVIVDETPAQTRWNIGTTTNVTLVANDRACCVPPDRPGEECLVLTHVCSVATNQIGGNVGAPAAPRGYASPGAGDHPFAGNIPIYGTVETMDGVDYYQFETSRFDESSSAWTAYEPIPVGSAGTIQRSYLDLTTSPFTWHGPQFPPDTVDGRFVYESLQHYEDTHPPNNWGSSTGRLWVGSSRDLLVNWLTKSETWQDGLYKLRVKAFRLAGANLQEIPLNTCGGDAPNEIYIRVDNRLEDDPAHATGPGHECGFGTVHLCVTEPDTDIVSVKVNPGNRLLLPCEQENVSNSEEVEIVFFAHDPNGHLESISLVAFYDENLVIDLLSGPHTLTAAGAVGAIPAASPGDQTSYVPVADGQWAGGVYRLVVPASRFPKTCCYTLRLLARKRTIINCSRYHENISQYSFMIIKT